MQEVTLKSKESIIVDGVTIKNTYGGHETDADGKDQSFVKINLSKDGQEKSFILNQDQSIEWNGFLLKAVEIGWNGEYIKMMVEESNGQ